MPARTVVFILASLLGAGSLAAQDKPLKYALLVGVAKYHHTAMNQPTALEFPEADAKALGEVLKRSGYTVDLLLGSQAKQQSVRDKLTGLKRQGNDPGVVFVGLFGHGVEYEGTDSACYCPYDTAMREVKDSQGKKLFDNNAKELKEPDPTTLIAMSEILTALNLCPAGNRVLVADCCRKSPHRARGRAFGANLKLSDVPENTAILFACSANEEAFEFEALGHGAFTKCLLDEIDGLTATGSVTMGTLAERVKPKVIALVNSQTNGKKKQSPKFLITDSVDLQLTPRPVPNPKLITSKSTGMKLTLIPAGTFQMGSSAAEVRAAVQADSNFKAEYAKNEQPHSVRISQPFYMGVHEVTQGEYESVMGTNPSSFSKSGTSSSGVSGLDTSKFPVEKVSWYDAIEFCNKLSVQDGLTPCYTLTNATRESGSIKSATVTPTAGKGYRLPTEAEWEYACRGGSTTVWHTGNTLASLNEAGWWGAFSTPAGNSEKRTNRVGQKSANAFGLFDMHGNVWEWCFDVYDESVYGKRSGTTSDPMVTSGSEARVLRGGSWSSNARYTRSALRLRGTPVSRDLNYGFRVVCLGVRTP